MTKLGATSERPVAADAWLWPLDVRPDEREALLAHLSADERLRADRFVHRVDRERWIVARGRMREFLSEVTGRSPSAIRFTALEHGRLTLEDDGGAAPSFNLSHAGGLAALVSSFEAEVGVDVEALRPMTDDEVDYALSPAERRSIESLEGQDRLEAFFEFWTLKEAFIKALGLGLSLPLHDFDMALAGDGPARLARLAGAPDEPSRWRFAVFAPADGYCGAVAARTEGRELNLAWHGPCSFKPGAGRPRRSSAH